MSVLNFKSRVTSEGYVVTCSVTSSGSFPSDVFLMRNSDNGPTEFMAVCSMNDFKMYQTWVGVPIRVFGNRYVKVFSFTITLDLSKDVNAFKNLLVSDLRKLKAEFDAAGPDTTETITI